MDRGFVELFAGCGGMSLGLESLGFRLVLANELSPMAGQTFAMNHLDIDLTSATPANDQQSKVRWISSNFPSEDIEARLTEDPHEMPLWGEGGKSDLPEIGPLGNGDLLIGNIITLNDYLQSRNSETEKFSTSIDLVSGGPPCQSFSMAGLRQRDNHRNRLPWEFARFVSIARPRIALLENVSGILRPFQEEGTEYHAWVEVAKAFAEIGYAPICLHVNAKYVGVPQNRPRYVMIAIRRALLESCLSHDWGAARPLFDQASRALQPGFDWTTLRYWNVDSLEDRPVFIESVLSPFMTHEKEASWITVEEAIGDLIDLPQRVGVPSPYVESLSTTFSKNKPLETTLFNTDLRRHSLKVRQRFRLYQVLSDLGPDVNRRIRQALRSGDFSQLGHAITVLRKKTFLFHDEILRRPKDDNELIILLAGLATLKNSQKALRRNKCAPAALSIPDDCCHYSPGHLRTLSVREMARLQSFPDHFVFKSQVTTGGRRRKFEVPQYTQVGNAVPPLLARQAGRVVLNILEVLDTVGA